MIGLFLLIRVLGDDIRCKLTQESNQRTPIPSNDDFFLTSSGMRFTYSSKWIEKELL